MGDGHKKNEDIIFGVRPEDMKVFFDQPEGRSIDGGIYVTELLGNKTIVNIKLGSDVIKVVDKASFKGEPEQKVWLKMK